MGAELDPHSPSLVFFLHHQLHRSDHCCVAGSLRQDGGRVAGGVAFRGVTLPASEMWPVNEASLIQQKELVRVEERGMYTHSRSLYSLKGKSGSPLPWSVDQGEEF